MPQLPDLPTTSELGFAGFEGVGWADLIAPKGTPPEVIDKISTDARKVLNEPQMQALLIERGMVVDARNAREWGEFVNSEVTKWAEVAKRSIVKAVD